MPAITSRSQTRVFVFIAVFAAAISANAADVSHQVNQSDFSGTTVNRCNGEVVQYSGSCRIMETFWTDKDGSTRVKRTIRCHADGYGSYGNRYVLNESFLAESDNPVGYDNPYACSEPYATDHMIERAHLVSQGSDDNFWLRLDFRFTYSQCLEGPPQVVVDAEVECRG